MSKITVTHGIIIIIIIFSCLTFCPPVGVVAVIARRLRAGELFRGTTLCEGG
jgi:hypothetical protein